MPATPRGYESTAIPLTARSSSSDGTAAIPFEQRDRMETVRPIDASDIVLPDISDVDRFSGDNNSNEEFSQTVGFAYVSSTATAPVTDTEWECSICTMQNRPSVTTCVVCSSSRFHADNGSSNESCNYQALILQLSEEEAQRRVNDGEATTVECRNCTYLNLSHLHYCEMCDSPLNPSSAIS
jgi:hypothetical protein